MENALTSDVDEAGIERRNLQALGIGCVVFALVAFLGLKIWAAVVNCAVAVTHEQYFQGRRGFFEGLQGGCQ